MPKKYLFVAGAPRSGTTAMVDLLNCHGNIIMLQERYSNLVIRTPKLQPAHFAEERLFTFEAGDSFYDAVSSASGHDRLRPRYAAAVYVGDKVPRLYERMDWIAQNFAHSTLVFMSRNVFDVAASYNRRARDDDDTLWPAAQDFRVAVQDWNLSHRLTAKAIQGCRNIDVIGVDYERIFFDLGCYNRLLNRLGLPTEAAHLDNARLEQIYRGAAQLEARRGDGLASGEKRFLCMKADFLAYKDIHLMGDWIG
jgi:hypothetical protein